MSDTTLTLITYVVAFVLALLAPGLPAVQKFIDAKFGAGKFQLIANLANMAVTMVEQQLEKAPNTQKKAAAVAAFQGLAKEHNLKVNEATMHTAIESAVYNLPKFIDASFGTFQTSDLTTVVAPGTIPPATPVA